MPDVRFTRPLENPFQTQKRLVEHRKVADEFRQALEIIRRDMPGARLVQQALIDRLHFHEKASQ